VHDDAAAVGDPLARHPHELDEHELECTELAPRRRQAGADLDDEVDIGTSDPHEQTPQACQGGVHVQGPPPAHSSQLTSTGTRLPLRSSKLIS